MQEVSLKSLLFVIEQEDCKFEQWKGAYYDEGGVA